MLFKILSIQYGWFDIDFNRGWVLTNSDYLGCDAPCLLLESLGDLVEDKTTEAWLCWQDEPGASILHLDRQGDKLIIRIYDTDKESWDLDYSGIMLSKHTTECLFTVESKLKDVAKSIFDEFGLYESGNGRQRYDANWGGFPQLQYDRLKRFLSNK